jgi:hypothetical protein
MREIEDVYENMSRERVHHKECKNAPSSKDPMNAGTADDSDSDDDEDETQGPTDTQSGQAVGSSDSGSDSDYLPPGTNSGGSDSRSPGDSDMEELDSEGGVMDSYGFGDL